MDINTHPGLMAQAVEPSEKQKLTRGSNNKDSTAASFLSSPQPAPAYPQPMVGARVSESSSECTVPREVRTTDLKLDRDRFTGFEPLNSSSSTDPLIPREQSNHSTIPSAASNRYPSPRQERRRSVDGGVRLAGGLPGQEDPTLLDDRRSSISTLPPAYQEHTAT